ncbi:hypothetical protein [Rhizosphaericola mali]|uniref:Uncharacterized protein n=1 Tax=Rhizosphaericola mali TaxID=2545455 RepID=A0A5P2G392_9BACT|nr:hypothetical protein [Rhizosphaericola mali]QES90276.1 hypothetical protein E0W69_017000 [Rhizosphaericola mali]
MKLIQRQPKRFNLITICSILLVVTYFLPWIIVDFLKIHFTGLSISTSYKNFDFLKKNTYLNISYLLWGIPLLSLLHIGADIFGFKGWFLRLDFLAGIAAVVITYIILRYIDKEGPTALVYGYYCSAIISFIGGLLGLLKYLKEKK